MNSVRTFLLTFLTFLSVPMYPQSITSKDALDRFFSKTEERSAYDIAKPKIKEIFDSAEAEKLPVSVLFDRLQEGATKHATPDALIAAIAEEIERLRQAAPIFTRINDLSRSIRNSDFFVARTSPVDATAIYEETMRQFSIFLRSGLYPESIERILVYACTKGIPDQTALIALGSLVRIPGVRDLSALELERLGTALLGSTLAPSGYSTLSSLYLKGRINGLSYSSITDIIVDTLERGGGLVRIEKEITRRSGKQ